ncbi:MAG: phosphotransferase family protein [Acidimicrobiia bacterium]
MELDDPSLPAVIHLTGPGARDVVGAAVIAAGGVLHDLRAGHVQYRPGADLVVRYRADVTWADGRRSRSETLLAAADRRGRLPGTIPVEADADGEPIVASVWRWPFDPALPGLERAATPGGLDGLTRPVLGGTRGIEVVAYRPTERAVVRIDGERRTGYVKVLRPDDVDPLVARHHLLADAGLPVPEVLAASVAEGVVVLADAAGTTLRERVKAELPGWPSAAELARLLDAVHELPPPGPSGRASRIADGSGHAALLARVAPGLEAPLRALADRFRAELPAVRARSGATVHGDVHEGQLVVGPGGAVTGLLDLDDVGAGDPLDDLATLAAHLRFRAQGAEGADHVRRRLVALSDDLRRRAADRHGREATDVAVAAVLVGLATGPFRLQRPGWPAAVAATVADASVLAGVAASADEGLLKTASSEPHAGARA